MNEVGYDEEYETVRTCGGMTMVLGGRTSHGMKLHRSGMTVGMNLGIARGKKDRRIGTNLGVGLRRMISSRMRVQVERLRVSNP